MRIWPFYRRERSDEFNTWGSDRILLSAVRGHGFGDLARSLERQQILDRLESTDPDFAAELRERWQQDALDESFDSARRLAGDSL
jgi:hypothetical protein